MLSVDGDADAAVETRIRVGWNKFRQLIPLLTNKDVSLIVRGRVYSSCVHSSMLRGSESWPVRKENGVALQLRDDWWPRYVWVGERFFWYRLIRVVPNKIQRAVKQLCVFVFVCYNFSPYHCLNHVVSWIKGAKLCSLTRRCTMITQHDVAYELFPAVCLAFAFFFGTFFVTEAGWPLTWKTWKTWNSQGI